MVANQNEKAKFAQRLSQALTHANIPDDRGRRAQVSKMFRVSTEAVRKWLAGESIPDTKRIPELAKALGVRAEWLLAGVGAMIEGEMQKHELVEHQLSGRSRHVPVVGMARMGAEGYYEEMGYPVGHGDGFVDVPTTDPDAYALEVKGDSMMPALRPGWLVVIEPNQAPIVGEFVMVKTKAGQVMVKELTFDRDDEVTLSSINETHGRITLDKVDIEKIHPVAYMLPPSRRRSS